MKVILKSAFMRYLLWFAVTSLYAIVPVAATELVAGERIGSAGSQPTHMEASLAAYRAQHGVTWQVEIEHETGYARLLHGGRLGARSVPTSDDEFVSIARDRVGDAIGLLAIERTDLELPKTTFLPLGTIGSVDKIGVRFQQVRNGVPVIDGYVNVLLDVRGALLSIDSTGLPIASNFETRPSVGPIEASARALDAFFQDSLETATSSSAPRLTINQARSGGRRGPMLCWEIETRSDATDIPIAIRYYIDANNGNVLAREGLIHHDVSGQVRARATPGTSADDPTNAAVLQGVPHLQVFDLADPVFGVHGGETDVAGYFTLFNAPVPVDLYCFFQGPFAFITNAGGSDYTLNATAYAATGNTLVMNPNATEFVTAQANAFLWLNKLRDWVRSVNPMDATADIEFDALVNRDSGFCNAFYDGFASTLNFPRASGPCRNMAFSSVILHEAGHWLNDVYGSGNGSDGFGEGAADTYAMYVLDRPLLGEGFEGPGTSIRDGWNTSQLCGSIDTSCYATQHAKGQVLMGALWKVRERVKADHGVAGGGQIANTLFNAWMNAFDDTTINPLIRTHWLLLDDDDGDLANGTPHGSQIDGGFRDQGFPSDYLVPVVYVNTASITLPWFGTQAHPFELLANGLSRVSGGGEIVAHAGVYNELLTINQAVEITASGGTVVIED